MPRDLADVLHYFLPELESEPEPTRSAPADLARERDRPESPPALPILGIPIGDGEILGAALAWNLAVETARLSGAATLLTPTESGDSPLWPEPGTGPLGTGLRFSQASDLADLHREALALARAEAARARDGGILFVRIPTRWLPGAEGARRAPESAEETRQPFRWILLLAPARTRELKPVARLASDLLRSDPGLELAVTIHGARTIDEARRAFDHLSTLTERAIAAGPSRPGDRSAPRRDVLSSCGMLVDDLHVYRAIAAQKPIGLAHPQAPAARALMDVARILYEDSRRLPLG
ncbi:MAG TPA: hypothetical protein VKA74_00880 [Myxococcota bacterium]|nr:hypothetical protein [Myxococcota bacterium]